ncbi:hypothetical protein [Kiloniella antarctica]|uniref:Uncharacterized protein n=1 Tax=Kiloniella antarctica TaxID=1550907 RepID=A0ABW5BMJ2_9PROT
MIEAYKILEDNEQQITYEYNSVLTWGIFGALGVGLAGIFLGVFFLQVLCGIAMVAYLYIGFTKVNPINKKVRAALRDGSLTMKGSKYSFSNPLQLTLTKKNSSE